MRDGIVCGACGGTDWQVRDSRASRDEDFAYLGGAVRRRRVCTRCGWRMTTLEVSRDALADMVRKAERRALARLVEAAGQLARSERELTEAAVRQAGF